MPIEGAITIHRYLDQRFVTLNSLMDGIVLWELQVQECQQRVCYHIDVLQTGQGGWMVLILQWKMVKFTERSALVIVTPVANSQKRFLLKTVDHTSSTNFLPHLLATHVTVPQTE